MRRIQQSAFGPEASPLAALSPGPPKESESKHRPSLRLVRRGDGAGLDRIGAGC